MNYLQLVRFIILPQALVKVIPPTVNTVIGMFKDTSLVIIIALFDLMGTTKASMTDMDWMGFSLEAYLNGRSNLLCNLLFNGKFFSSIRRRVSEGERKLK